MKKRLLSAVVLISFIFTLVACGEKQENIVAYVDGIPIYKEEMQMHIDMLAVDIAADLENSCGLDFGDADFWSQKVEGKKTSDVLIERVVHQLGIWHMQFKLATEKGIDNACRDYYDWRKEYKEYKAYMTEQGIGAPDTLTFDIYMSGQMSKIKIDVIDKCADKLFVVTDTELKKYYIEYSSEEKAIGETPKSFDEVKTDLKYEIFEDKYDAYIEKMLEGTQVELVEDFEKIEFDY